MITETFFTLAEYKRNYDRFKNEFVSAYIDNDEEEFIALQMEWYKRCIKNTILKHGVIADSIGWETKAKMAGKGFVGEVDQKLRNERGGINPEVAQNLNVSFKLILKFLKRQNEKIHSTKTTAVQWALYYYFLQESEMMPPFKEKTTDIKALSKEFKIGWKNFEMKYNTINNSRGLEGYSEKDVNAVLLLLKEDYSSLIPQFEKLTLHIS